MVSLKEFYLYIKHPDPIEKIGIYSFKSFLILVWESFFILFLFDIIFGLVLSIPLRYLNLFPVQKEINYSLYIILKFSILLPIIEELIFRLPLKISKINLATSFSLIVFIVLNKWCFSDVYMALGSSMVLFLSLNIGISKESWVCNKMTHFLTDNFLAFFYFQALIFGFLHLTNYIIDIRYFYLFPFIVISYISKGCLFGYLRVRFKNGIYLCIASHIVANSIYCLILSR